MVWHLDVGSSHPGAVAGPKGWAVRDVYKRQLEGVKNAIITAVRDAGPNACPPMVIGVGIMSPSTLSLLKWGNTAPGCDEPTSRCQTSPSMWTLGGDQPVIPRVAFIR